MKRSVHLYPYFYVIREAAKREGDKGLAMLRKKRNFFEALKTPEKNPPPPPKKWPLSSGGGGVSDLATIGGTFFSAFLTMVILGMRRITYPCFHKKKLPCLYYLDVSGVSLVGPNTNANLYCIFFGKHETYAYAVAVQICGNI